MASDQAADMSPAGGSNTVPPNCARGSGVQGGGNFNFCPEDGVGRGATLLRCCDGATTVAV